MVNPIRLKKLESLVKQRVAVLLSQELSDPRAAFITVTRVKIDREIQVCKIFYTVLGDEKRKKLTAHLLEHAKGFIRSAVAKVLHTRKVPEIRFQYDDSVEGVLRLDKIIDEAAREARDLENRLEEEDPGKEGEAGFQEREKEEEEKKE